MKAQLVSSQEIAPAVQHFVFEVPEVEALPYQAGQFVSLSRVMPDGKAITRAYSTASPAQGNRFELCLNMVTDGRFSPHLFGMQPGDAVDMKGPLGTFVWRNPVNDSILVATGTGIAPFRGMLQELLPKDEHHQITLVFGVRHEHSLLYRDEFEALARQHPNFRFVPTLSRPDETWKGARGYVQEQVLATLGERRDLDVYICGMKAMVDDLRAQLKAIGFDRRQIIYEKYD